MKPTVHGPGYSMGWAGAQRDVLAGDLSAHADLRGLAALPHVNALGPLAALRGEVTVIDGMPFVSTVAAGGVAVEQSFAHHACFLVYAQVRRWRWTAVDGALAAMADLDPILLRAAAAAGLDPDAPFPFRCHGRSRRPRFTCSISATGCRTIRLGTRRPRCTSSSPRRTWS